MEQKEQTERTRIDKWLWAARFYKTRGLATEEIDKGRVHLNGVTVKPAREVKVGDTVQLRMQQRTGVMLRTVTVLTISDKRGSAPMAALLFAETAESQALRAAAAEAHRLSPEPALSQMQGRPTKRDRRSAEQVRELGNREWGNRWSASVDPEA
jgi:ribosome-associated heat shock protein Hsp15